jgi:flagellar L-ring protein precursor FlgH
MKYCIPLLAALSLYAQTDASPGSLFSSSGLLADAARDVRAGQPGDIVTILVSDSASAIAKGVTNSSRKSAAKNGISALGGVLSSTNPLVNLATLGGDQQVQGQGQTSRDMVLTTTLTARVVAQGPSGTLWIEGTKNIQVNSENQTIVLSGLIRGVDVTRANTIRSDQIADLAIHVNGKGVVGDAIKRPFVLYRILLGLMPF